MKRTSTARAFPAAHCLALALVCMTASPGMAQSGRVGLALASGLNIPNGSSRFSRTDPGYMVEGTVRLRLPGSWQAGVGTLWGTFGAVVPEFATFEPLDHAAWLEHSMLFGEVRYVAKSVIPAVRPFLGGRLGLVRELAEYSGATIRRTGPAIGALFGADWQLVSRLSLQLSSTFVAAALGSGDLRNMEGSAPAALSRYWDLRAGLEVWAGN